MLVTPWFFLMSRAVSLNIPRRWWAKLGAPMPSATHIDGGMLAGACVALDKELENDLVVRNRAWRSSSVTAASHGLLSILHSYTSVRISAKSRWATIAVAKSLDTSVYSALIILGNAIFVDELRLRLCGGATRRRPHRSEPVGYARERQHTRA